MTNMLTRRAFVVGAPLTLAACAAESIRAPESVVNKAIYRSNGPTALSLYTVKNSGSDSGAHSALLVEASQSVLFDPAGSYRAEATPERDDVHFGFSPAAEEAYTSFHSRSSFYVIVQKIQVPPAVAEQALQLVISNGAVPKANCTRSISAILKQLPGFEGLGRTWFPNTLERDFADLPGVQTSEVRELD